MNSKLTKFTLVLFCIFFINTISHSQTTVKKVVLQGFWWDYENDNFPNSWANYLTELAPRLKALGIDAVWIPPSYKNTGTNSVGYSPFDHYDLGDKFQKNSTTTRFGTKDEFLRMVAVLHANGIEVIQDVVLNHVDGAGATNGAGGQDTDATYSTVTNGGFKNFRYACYETPVTANPTANDYWSRKGRWSKNYQNFHPHTNHNVNSGEWETPYWGPDFCYGYQEDGTGNGHGTSSNATCGGCHNPSQASGYNRDHARDWLMWMVKQTDVDGFRWDAVKHFPHFVVQDLSYNVKYLNLWASRGETMLNFGEYVGGGATLDTWINDVATSNGGSEKLVGAIDFGLRGAFYGIVTGNGNYDLSQVPSTQQQERVTYYSNIDTYNHITIPFVNSHDTYRPQLDATGNITGWNTSEELAPHIESGDPRLGLVYALAFALDGNPLIFIEDLFDLNNGKRFTHQPTNTTDLVQHLEIENIIWCHQQLDFKSGAYLVRPHNGNAGDHLIVERSGKAIIGANDNWTNWQTDWVDSNFPPGTVLQDYSGSSTNTVTVQNDQRVQISTPPCDGSATRRGYSIWAPVGLGTTPYTPSRSTITTQEWEMANDLGDSHCNSLGQGGALPDFSTEFRTVGKIYADSGKTVDIEVYPEDGMKGITMEVFDIQNNLLHTASGTTSLLTSYTPTTPDWLVIRVKNTNNTHTGQKCWVKVAYTAPQVVNTAANPPSVPFSVWEGDVSSDWANCENWQEGKIPTAFLDAVIPPNAPNMPLITTGATCQTITIENGATLSMGTGGTINVRGDFKNEGTFTIVSGCPIVRFTVNSVAPATQVIVGSSVFCNLYLNNPQNVRLEGNTTVTGDLRFLSGSLELEDADLTMTSTANFVNNNATKYILTKNTPSNGGTLIQEVGNSPTLFPVGTATSYTPVTITNHGASQNFQVRTFDGVYNQGNQGGLIMDMSQVIDRTWEILPTNNPSIDVKFQWNVSDEGNDVIRSTTYAAIYHNGNWTASGMTALSGSNPYTRTANNVSNFTYFAISDADATITNTKDLPTKIQFYAMPNPFSDHFAIGVLGNYQQEQLNVFLYTADGKLVQTYHGNLDTINTQLQTKSWVSGVYIVRIVMGEMVEELKVVKQ